MSDVNREADLERLYKAAPRLKSPAALDDQVMAAARSTTDRRSAPMVRNHSAAKKRRLPGIGMSLPVFAMMCVVGVGLGLLLKTESEQQTDSVDSGAGLTADSGAVNNAEAELSLQQTESFSTGEVVADATKDVSEETMDSDAMGVSDMSRSAALQNAPVQERAIVLNSIVLNSRVDTSQTHRSEGADSSNSNRSESASTVRQKAEVYPELAVDTLAKTNAGQTVPSVPARMNSAPVTATKSRQWLAEQSTANFTIQIARSNNLEPLRRSAAVLGAQTEIVQLESDLWVQLYGSYQDQRQARQSLDKLKQTYREMVDNNAVEIESSDKDTLISEVDFVIVTFEALLQLAR